MPPSLDRRDLLIAPAAFSALVRPLRRALFKPIFDMSHPGRTPDDLCEIARHEERDRPPPFFAEVRMMFSVIANTKLASAVARRLLILLVGGAVCVGIPGCGGGGGAGITGPSTGGVTVDRLPIRDGTYRVVTTARILSGECFEAMPAETTLAIYVDGRQCGDEEGDNDELVPVSSSCQVTQPSPNEVVLACHSRNEVPGGCILESDLQGRMTVSGDIWRAEISFKMEYTGCEPGLPPCSAEYLMEAVRIGDPQPCAPIDGAAVRALPWNRAAPR